MFDMNDRLSTIRCEDSLPKETLSNCNKEQVEQCDDAFDFSELSKQIDDKVQTSYLRKYNYLRGGKDKKFRGNANNSFNSESESSCIAFDAEIWENREERRDSSSDFDSKFRNISEEMSKKRSRKSTKNQIGKKNTNLHKNSSSRSSSFENLKTLLSTCGKKINNNINENEKYVVPAISGEIKENVDNKFASAKKLLNVLEVKDSPYNYVQCSPLSATTCHTDGNFNAIPSPLPQGLRNSSEFSPFYPQYQKFFTPNLERKVSLPNQFSENVNRQLNFNANSAGSQEMRKFTYPYEANSSNICSSIGNLEYSAAFPNNYLPMNDSMMSQFTYSVNRYPEMKSCVRNLNTAFESIEKEQPQTTNRKHLDDAVNRINIENILKGRDRRTTLMIRHIPNKYNLYTFLEDINVDFQGTYDVFYLPIDYKNNCNLGFAFINFVDPMHVLHFYDSFRGKKWRRFKSDKICELAYAKFQGKEELKTHFLNGSVIKLDSEDKKPVILPTPDPLPPVKIPLVN